MHSINKLIDQFVPSNYNLTLNLNRIERTFSGVVKVTGILQPNSSTISFHSKDLTISAITIDNIIADFKSSENDELVISQNGIKSGEHIVIINFNGEITDTMHGVYPSYFDHEGIKKELLATQFESHHAREVFPCIDEPAAKATFDVTLITEANVTVLGNMPIVTQNNDGQHLTTTFDTTPIMSSYLLAWVIGELHNKTAKTKSGVDVSVWSTVAQPTNNLDFALDIAVKSIEFYESYFGIPYPLPKSDQVAIPDFSAGAMENWGLVTYREIALLVDPKITSIFVRHHVALIIAHELSHQWFGNLVTMKWWNDLWLNESFATFMEYLAIDNIQPDWDIWLDFDDSECIYALRRDGLDGVQSVQNEVNHPDEIDTLFDAAIVYAKGARLIRMVHEYIGDEAFRAGLTSYFKTFAYKNTESNDLWTEFNKSSGKNTSLLMSRWIAQPGFPVVHASIKDNQITLSQERLMTISGDPVDTLWPIPLNSNYPEMPTIFDNKTITVSKQTDSVFRLNVGNSAHFITHYSHELLLELVNQIKTGKMSSIDRLQLLNEQTILARAGIISNTELFPLLDAYKDETTEIVWSIISLTISELRRFVETDIESESRLREYTSNIARNQYNRLGWMVIPGEPETDTKLRLYIISLMAFGESADVTAAATKIYNSAKFEDLVPEIRSLELSIVIRNSQDTKIVNELLNVYKNSNIPELRNDIGNGLTSAREKVISDILINVLKDTSIIRSQDKISWIFHLLINKYSRSAMWQWIQNNWSWVMDTFSGDKSLDDFPQIIAAALSTPAQLNEYREFFVPKRDNLSIRRSIDMGIIEIQDRISMINRDGEAVKKVILDL